MNLGSSLVRNAILAVLLGVGVFLGLMRNGDGPPPDDADLMALPAEIPEHENGLAALVGASELLQWPDDERAQATLSDMARGAAWDDAVAAQLLADNSLALDAFARAARAKALQSRPIRDIGADVPDMLGWIRLAEASAIRSLAAARAGDAQTAVEAALDAVRVGRLVAGNPNGALLAGTSGLRIGSAGLDGLEAGLPAIASAPEARGHAIAELDSLRIDPRGWRAMWASEYRTVRALHRDEDVAAIFDANDRGSMRWVAVWLPESYVYQPNNSWVSHLHRVRARIAAAGEICPVAIDPQPSVSDLGLLLPNGAGRLAASSSVPLAHYDALRCVFDTRIDMLRAALAALAFERDRGALPPSLEALVPTYLPTPPRDAFAEAPLRLDRATRTILSASSEPAAPTDASERARGLALPAPAAR